MIRRRPVGAGAACAVAALSIMLTVPLTGPALAAAPTLQGWWNSAHQGIQPPTPPDVPADGLLVQGAAAQPIAPGTPGLGGTPAEPISIQALSALTFTVPAGSDVESLVLKIAGSPPQSTSVYACPVTGPYQPVQNGEFAERPPFDCTTSATPILDPVGGTLGFGSDLAGLVSKGSLSFVLLPGGAERLVLQKPDAKALVLTQSGGTTGAPGAIPVDPGPPPALDEPTTGGPSFETGPSGSGEVPLGSELGSGPAETQSFGVGGTPAAPGPDVADPEAAGSPLLGGPRTGPTRATGAGAVDGPTRNLLLLALLAVGGALVLSNRPHVAAPLGAAIPAAIPPQERGIGRFRRLRDQRAVAL